jgi:hypothetical protein
MKHKEEKHKKEHKHHKEEKHHMHHKDGKMEGVKAKVGKK